MQGGMRMDVTEAILKRKTIRKMKPAPVERQKIEKVLEAARRAPSWGTHNPGDSLLFRIGPKYRLWQRPRAGSLKSPMPLWSLSAVVSWRPCPEKCTGRP